MVKKSRNKPIIWMYLLRLITAFGRGFDFSFSMLGMVFGLFFGSLLGNPLIICASLFGAFCIMGFGIKAMRDESREQHRLSSLQTKFQKLPPKYKLKLQKPPTLNETFIIPKKMLNRCREFFNSFNEAIKILIGIAATCGFTFCAITPFFGTFAIPLFIGFILAGIGLGTLVAVEYHLRRRREDKCRRYEDIIEKHRAEKYKLDKKSSYINVYQQSFKDKITNYLKMGLCLVNGAFAGIYFGFTIITLFFGIIFPSLPVLLPAFPLLAAVLIPIGLPLVIGLFFAIKTLRDERRAQQGEYEARKKYEQRLAKILELDPNFDIQQFKKPAPVSMQKISNMQTLKENIWLNLKKLGNRMIDAGRGMRNGARVLEWILKFNPILSIVVVVTTGCISFGIVGTFGFLALVPVVAFSLTIGAIAFMQYSIRSRHRKETQRLRDETHQIEKAIFKINNLKTSTGLINSQLKTSGKTEEIELDNVVALSNSTAYKRVFYADSKCSEKVGLSDSDALNNAKFF